MMGLPPPRHAPLTYLPQLDALRAFAALLVVWHHWIGPPDLPLGPIGVWIFFVISGFLITRILLCGRGDTAAENRTALARFYVRRVLRIFPLYYFVLLVGLIFSPALRANWPWYVTYLQNFKFIWAADPDSLFGVHLWTLAVEEQFYVVWPLIVLFLPRFLLLPAVGCAIAIAVATRAIATARGWLPFQDYAFTPCNLDTLGLGALLAYFVTNLPGKVIPLRRIALGGAVTSMVATSLFPSRVLGAALMQVPTGLIALWFIAHATAGVRRDWIGRLLTFPPSVYLGRISYGIYVYHFFVPDLVKPILHRFDMELPTAAFVAVCFVVTITIASLSWHLLENPINSLKNRFRVVPRQFSPAQNPATM